MTESHGEHGGGEHQPEKLTPADLAAYKAEMERRAKTKERWDKATMVILENAKKYPIPENVLARLRDDLLTNATADYSRVGLTEVFAAFNYDTRQTAVYWRIAKILDAVTACSDDLEMEIFSPADGKTPFQFKPGGLPTMMPELYKLIEEKKMNDKSWTVKVKVPGINAVHAQKVSLGDVVHFYDVMKLNRTLGVDRLSVEELAFNYFTGGDIETVVHSKTKDAGGVEQDVEQVVDLLDPKMNPRDDFNDIDIPAYKTHIRKSQTGLQQLDDWRFTSDGHREMAGQAFQVGMEDHFGDVDKYFVPTSGRIAQKITWEDLQKKNERGQANSLGHQPQEVGDLDEGKTGAIVRFIWAFLRQRRAEQNANKIFSATSIRMAKAMCGVTMLEEVEKKRETVKVNGALKKMDVIYLCGQKLEQDVIAGVKFHYNDLDRKIKGLPDITSKEAADLIFRDVFAPVIMNNKVDWMMGLTKTYSLGQPNDVELKGEFKDFIIRMYCKDYSEKNFGQITQQTFTSLQQLVDYCHKRREMGDLEQAPREYGVEGEQDISDVISIEVPEAPAITDEEAKLYSAALALILPPEYVSYLEQFSQGDRDDFLQTIVKDKHVPPGQSIPGREYKHFADVIKDEFEIMSDTDKRTILKDIFSIEDDEEAGFDFTKARRDFIERLRTLTPQDRKKLQINSP